MKEWNQLTLTEKWERAEENCKNLEESDSFLLHLPPARLREIRGLPFACYKALTEAEKFYWITVQERRGDDGEKLRHAITKLELSELKERVANYEDFLKDAVSVAGVATRGDIVADGSATREDIKSGFERFSDWGAALLEKIGLKKRNKRFPEVASSSQKKALEMWTKWPYTCLDAQRENKKVDCFAYHKPQLDKMGITELDHFKAVLDNARKH
jgi:hypothetical protein